MRRLLHLIDTVSSSERMTKVVAFQVVFLMAILMLEVVARYGFNRPTFWAHEISQYIFGAYFILGGAYVLRKREHIRVDVIYRRLSSRMKAILNVVIFASLFFLFCGVMMWCGAQVAWRSLLILEHSDSAWAPPLYPLKIIVALGALLIVLQGLGMFIRDLIGAIRGSDIDEY